MKPSRMSGAGKRQSPFPLFPRFFKIGIPTGVLGIIILFILVGPCPLIPGGETVSDLLYKARTKINREDYDGAIEDCNKALSIDQNKYKAYYCRGVARALKKDYDGAVADFETAIQKGPQLSELYFHCGLARIEKGDYDGAISDFTESIKLEADQEKAYNFRGVAWEKKGELDNAIEDYECAIYINRGYASPYYNWARVLGKKGDKKGMIEKLKKVIDSHPDNRKLLKKDEDFKQYHNNPDFKKLIGE